MIKLSRITFPSEVVYKDGELYKVCVREKNIPAELKQKLQKTNLLKTDSYISINNQGKIKFYTKSPNSFTKSFEFDGEKIIKGNKKHYYAYKILKDLVPTIPDSLIADPPETFVKGYPKCLPEENIMFWAKRENENLFYEYYFKFNDLKQLDDISKELSLPHPLPEEERKSMSLCRSEWFYHVEKDRVGDFILGSVVHHGSEPISIKVYKYIEENDKG